MSKFLSPRENFWGLRNELDRFFGDDGFPVARWNKEVASFVPTVDVAEQEGRYVLTFDIPGVKKEEIKIDVADNQLVVSGERRREYHQNADERPDGKKVAYTLTERSYGSFRRAFALPGNIDTQRIEAKLEDGVLRLTVPKDEQARSKRIEVR